MKNEISAGGIVFRKKDGQVEVLIIQDSYGNNAFPKGHQEKGETLEEAAERETVEEVNIKKIKLITKVGTTKFWFTFGGDKIHKTLHLYLFKSENPDAEPTPQYEIQGCEWVSLKDLPKIKTYKNLKPLVDKAVKLIYQNK